MKEAFESFEITMLIREITLNEGKQADCFSEFRSRRFPTEIATRRSDSEKFSVCPRKNPQNIHRSKRQKRKRYLRESEGVRALPVAFVSGAGTEMGDETGSRFVLNSRSLL